MRYALLVSYDENAEITAEERSRRAAGFASASARLRADRAYAGGLRLESASTAITVRCWDGGDVMVSPGPVAAVGEQLAACFVVDCPDADAAIELATHIPAAWYGSVEVRPVLAEPGQPAAVIPAGKWSVAERELDDPDDDEDHRDGQVQPQRADSDLAPGGHRRPLQQVQGRHPPVLPA